MNPPSITNFGSQCRTIRSKLSLRIIEQAKEFGCPPSEISAYEMGIKQPTVTYVAKFAVWTKIGMIEHQRLISLAVGTNNVVSLSSVRKRKNTPTIKLYRNIHEMSPRDIRNIGIDVKDDPQ